MNESEYIKKVEQDNERLEDKLTEFEKLADDMSQDIETLVYFLSIFIARDINDYWNKTNTPKKTYKGKREYRTLGKKIHEDIKQKVTVGLTQEHTDLYQELIDNCPELKDVLHKRISRNFKNNGNWLTRSP